MGGGEYSGGGFFVVESNSRPALDQGGSPWDSASATLSSPKSIRTAWRKIMVLGGVLIPRARCYITGCPTIPRYYTPGAALLLGFPASHLGWTWILLAKVI